LDLIAQVKALLSNEVDYIPHDIRDVLVLYGLPPVPVYGLEYVFARHNEPQTRLVMSLTGKGVFVPNQNKSGVIEFAVLNGTVTGAGIQIVEMLGMPFPMVITDKSSGGLSTVVALSARLIGTPEWRREALPGLDIYTFACDDLFISTGLRLSA